MTTMIVRVTTRCNFKCEFCSASEMAGKTLSPDAVVSAVKKYQPESVTLEGGDPLVLPPSYFEELFSKLLAVDPNLKFGVTTNLWNWYKNPGKWDVLKKYKAHICTSFQYGGKRKITDSRPLTEEIFVDMMTKWRDLNGYAPGFIAVIDDDNADSVLKTVKLAKHIKTYCKVNPLFVSGRATSAYPWDKMLGHYADIVEAGLAYWEDNAYQLAKLSLNTVSSLMCPIVPNCEKSFVVLNPDETIHHCTTDVSTNGAQPNVIKFYKKDTPIVSEDCLACDWFAYCNTCRVYRQEIKAYKTPEYCARVRDAMNRISAWAHDHKDYFDD